MTCKKIIRKHDVSVVYLTALRGFYELPLIAAAYKLDRIILLASHGGGRIKLKKFPKDFVEKIFIATWGEFHRKRLVGISKDRAFATGSPFLDKMAKYRTKRPPKKKKTVFFTTKAVYETPFIGKDEYFKKYVPKFLSQVNEAKGVGKIVMRLHPGEVGKYINEYKKVIRSLGLNIPINQQPGKEALYSIIRDSDLLISYGSAVDIEGLLLDRDVITIDGLKAASPCKEAVYRINKDGDLKTAVELILNDEKTQRKVRGKRERYVRELTKVDGKAYKRVANLIISLINKREKTVRNK